MKKLLLFLLCINIIISPKNVFSLSAESYIVMDMDNNEILYGNNYNNKHLIASITKIMTCIIAIEKGNLNIIVEADKDILKAIGSSIYIEIGEKMSLNDLLYGMMLRSGNDAALMIAKEVSGSIDSFTKLMNEYARKIGMHNTNFINSNGLEDANGQGNTSTAYDMALLTSYAMKNKTFRKIFATKSYTAKSNKKTYTWHNKNKLLKYDYINGGKTGYTIKAHRTLVTTGKINDVNIVIVTLDDSNDWNDHLKLYEDVKKTYQRIKIIDKKSFNIDNKDQYYVKDNIFLTVKIEDIKKINIKYYLINKNNYKDDDKVGYIDIYVNNDLIKTDTIYYHQVSHKFSLKRLFRKILKHP